MSKFNDILPITEIHKERALEAHRRNVAETRRLEGELVQIDALRFSAQHSSETIGARQILGADGLWQGWLLRKRADILQELAMAKALEGESLGRARQAFSRDSAVRELAEKEKTDRRKLMLQRQADQLDHLGQLR